MTTSQKYLAIMGGCFAFIGLAFAVYGEGNERLPFTAVAWLFAGLCCWAVVTIDWENDDE